MYPDIDVFVSECRSSCPQLSGDVSRTIRLDPKMYNLLKLYQVNIGYGTLTYNIFYDSTIYQKRYNIGCLMNGTLRVSGTKVVR